jgi:pimeloyl-ACP methyl ester carboxylesterase
MNRPTVALLVLIALVCGAPCAAQQQSKIVQVGERSVEVIEMGNGTPTLILEGGVGESATDWRGVLPALAAHTRVIAYSRPGYRQSGAAAGPPSPQASVQQLHALLATLGEGAPVVIVGHSWGGLLARLYVSTYKLSFIHQAIACTKAHPLIIRFRSWNIIRSADILRFVLSGS